jgi:hypothetical protein
MLINQTKNVSTSYSDSLPQRPCFLHWSPLWLQLWTTAFHVSSFVIRRHYRVLFSRNTAVVITWFAGFLCRLWWWSEFQIVFRIFHDESPFVFAHKASYHSCHEYSSLFIQWIILKSCFLCVLKESLSIDEDMDSVSWISSCYLRNETTLNYYVNSQSQVWEENLAWMREWTRMKNKEKIE